MPEKKIDEPAHETLHGTEVQPRKVVRKIPVSAVSRENRAHFFRVERGNGKRKLPPPQAGPPSQPCPAAIPVPAAQRGGCAPALRPPPLAWLQTRGRTVFPIRAVQLPRVSGNQGAGAIHARKAPCALPGQTARALRRSRHPRRPDRQSPQRPHPSLPFRCRRSMPKNSRSSVFARSSHGRISRRARRRLPPWKREFSPRHPPRDQSS